MAFSGFDSLFYSSIYDFFFIFYFFKSGASSICPHIAQEEKQN